MGRGSFDSARRSSVASSLTSPRKEYGTSFGQGNFAEEPEELEKGKAGAAVDVQPPQRDILADMDAFQREIDALRKVHEGS